jgi:small subunit ribosomal protein S24e
MANVSRKNLIEKLSKIYKVKEDLVTVYGLRTAFGGGSSTGFATVYDTIDSRKKFDQKHLLIKDGVKDKIKGNRRGKKDLKLRLKKVRGAEKAKIARS